MVTVLTERQRFAADAVIGDVNDFMHDCRRALSDGARGEAFLLLMLARLIELHPHSYREARGKSLT